MRNLKRIIYVLFFFQLYSCSNDNIYICNLIDLTEWNKVTDSIIREKIHLDTILIFNKNRPPLIMRDGKTIVNSYEEDMKFTLSFRKRILEVLRQQKLLLNVKYFYVYEFYGYTTNGYEYNIQIIDNKKRIYDFEYNESLDSMFIKKIDYFKYWNDYLYLSDENFYSEVEMGTMTGISIVTLVKINKKNKISYNIRSVCVR
ncbi:MAG: hypothetical protein PHI52_01540 [Bacteroidales bacterium]|nr:hypothetical protein [Bacteroidales bacterium]